MEIPADAFLIDSNEITTDESAMTGNIWLILRWDHANEKGYLRKMC